MASSYSETMQFAIREARKAGEKGEVPVGAVVVAETGEILARAHNLAITLSDPTAHAEILALRQAAGRLSNYRLLNTVLYVTLEPCVMCMGAIVHARVAKVVFGADDPKWGAAGSLYDFSADGRLNHRPGIVRGVCRETCVSLIREFFRAKRKNAASGSGV